MVWVDLEGIRKDEILEELRVIKYLNYESNFSFFREIYILIIFICIM